MVVSLSLFRPLARPSSLLALVRSARAAGAVPVAVPVAGLAPASVVLPASLVGSWPGVLRRRLALPAGAGGLSALLGVPARPGWWFCFGRGPVARRAAAAWAASVGGSVRPRWAGWWVVAAPSPPASSSLPSAVVAALAAAAAVGFSGARSLSPAALSAVVAAAGVVGAGGARSLVGCAAGADQVALSALVAAGAGRRCRVFAAGGPASAVAWWGSAVAAGASVAWWAGGGPALPLAARLARRSVACVRAVAAAAGGLWCAFPAGPCPPGLRPAAAWASSGSGTWSSLALAVGLGLPALVCLPAGVLPPAGWPGWAALGGGWWSVAPPPPPAVQLALFC